MKIRKMVIADSQQLVRSAIKNLLQQHQLEQEILDTGNLDELFKLITQPELNLLITETDWQQAPNLIGDVLRARPDLKVMVLSSNKELNAVAEAFRQGAAAYIFKDSGFEELSRSIACVENGKRYICHQLAEALLETNLNRSLPSARMLPELTSRELEILELISEGRTNLQIAEKLFLSKRTVEGHRQSLLDKTHSRNSAQLIRFALRNELIS